jgi:cytidylate kinase
MAIYTFRNKRSGKAKEYEMPIGEYDQFKEDHPNLERIMDNVGIAFRGRGDRTATELAVARDPGWGEVLSKIGQQNPHTDLNADYTKKKTHKNLKAEAVVEKHVKIQQKQRERYARKR